MVHFKDLLKENKFCSYIDVLLDPRGEVVNFTSEFGDESLEDVQKMVNVLIREGYIKLDGTVKNVSINIDDIGDEENPYCIDLYFYDEDGNQDEDNTPVIPFDQELLDKFLIG